MKTVIIVFAVLLLCVPAQAQLTWQFANGPWYANIEDFAIGASYGQVVLYAADSVDVETSSDAFVLKSTDRGESWTHKPIAGVTGTVKCVATFRSNPNIVYAGVWLRGVYKSTDGGTTWNTTASLINVAVTRIAIHPTNPQTVWVGCQRVFQNYPVLYRSTDAGGTWVQLSQFGFPSQLSVSDIAVAGDTVWVSTYDGTGQNVGVWRTLNGGQTWRREITGMGTGNLHLGSLAVDPNNPDVLYAGNRSGNVTNIYKTTDGTQDCMWDTVYEGQGYLSFTDLRISPSDSNTAFASVSRSGSSVLRTTDGGVNWSFLPVGAHLARMDAVEIDPINAAIVYAGSFPACYRSDDNGQSWEEKNVGAFLGQVKAIAKSGSRIYTSTLYTIFRSTTAGSLWRVTYSVDEDQPQFDIAIDPSNSLSAVAAGARDVEFPAIFLTEDGGENWTIREVNPTPLPCEPSSVNSVALGNNGIEEIYTATSKFNQLECIQVARSTNRGQSWALLLSQSSKILRSIRVSGPVIYTGGRKSSGAVILKSTDSGQNWTELDNGLPTGSNSFVTSLSIDPTSANIVYAATTYGMYKTTNGGSNWFAINGGITYTNMISVLVHPINRSVVYAASNDDEGKARFYRSTNGGGSWSEMSTGLPQKAISDLTIDPADPNAIFAATDAGGYSIPHIWTGEIAADVTWQSGETYLVEGTLTVASGKTLTIEPGATVKFFPPYGELMVNGTLQALGEEASRINFVSYQPASEWRGIRLPTARSGSRIEYADIADAVIGIAVNHNSEATIAHCNIRGGKIGIHLYDAPGPWPLLRTNVLNNEITQSRIVAISVDKEVSNVLIQDNTLTGNFNDDVGLQFIYASPLDVLRNRVTNFGKHGIQCISASPSFIDGTQEGGRSCFVNNRIGVYGEASSNFILGIAYDDGTYSGNNTIAYNEEFQIALVDNCTVYSQMNYHGDRNFNIDGSSRLIADPDLGEDPNRCLDQGNRPLAIAAGDQVKETDPPMLSGFTRNPLVKHAVRLRLRRDHLAAIGVLKGLIAAQATNTALVHWALNELLANYQMVPNPSGSNILSGYFRGLLLTQSNAEIRRAIRDVLSGSLRHERQIAATLAALDTCIQSYPNTSSELLALYSKISLALNVLNDRTLAQATFQTLQAQYPEHSLTHIAGVLVNGGGQLRPTGKSTMAAANTSSSEKPLSYALEQNYPNPFNPTTTIKFRIPERGHVVLRIYDIVGREVKTLLDEQKEAGYYETRFDASQLASGMYPYRIQAGNYVETKKLLLLK